MKSTISGIFTAITLLLLNPIYAPAQSVTYAQKNELKTVAILPTSEMSNQYNTSKGSANFNRFAAKHKVAALGLQKAYGGMYNFSFTTEGALTHTFFHHAGNRIHVVFNQKNRKLLEITEWDKNQYPEAMLNDVQQLVGNGTITVAKTIRSQNDSWYEILLDKQGKMEKLEVAID